MLHQTEIKCIVDCLKAGGVLALPTETIYGLCCDPRNTRAVERLFSIKQRDPSKAVLSIAGSREQVDQIASVPSSFEPIARRFWPGPLTVILTVKPDANISPLAVHQNTIALRLSPDPLLQEVTRLLGSPIVATSANISGQPFLRSAEEVRRVFGSVLDLIIETDHELLQIPSTIIRCTAEGEAVLVREGAIPYTPPLTFSA